MNGQATTDAARVAAALERLAPPQVEVDWSVVDAAEWRCVGDFGRLHPHARIEGVGLDDLLGVERQKRTIDLNTRQFIAGLPANNVLLWGSRGTGKSTLVHALLNRYRDDGLRLVQVDKAAASRLAELADMLAGAPYRFVLFFDDLSFEAEDASYKALKSALEGSVFKGMENLVIYATSNRRHLLPEYMSDNQASRVVQDHELHHGEAVEEKISLSDRFGIWLSFYAFPQDGFIDIARHWVAALAQRHGVAVAFDDDARAECLRWALARGGRSGRVAQQFARHWVGSRALATRSGGAED
jgi:predicted AAA+ superfamily ATPase